MSEESPNFPLKYMHVERIGNAEVRGIGEGKVYIFPKLDGANAVIWFEEYDIKFGSRNEYKGKIVKDKNGLYLIGQGHSGLEKWIMDNHKNLLEYFTKHPDDILYGEWMKRHTIKTYLPTVWDTFYVFDVYQGFEDGARIPLHYYNYCGDLQKMSIPYIEPLCVGEFESDKDLHLEMEKVAEANTYLMQDGFIGEGVVAKRYNYSNPFGHKIWAKYVRPEFKAGVRTPRVIPDDISEKIANDWCTHEFIIKEYLKFIEEFPDENINRGRLLETIVRTFWTEESYNLSKKIRFDLNMQRMNKAIYAKIKETLPEVGW